MNTPLLATSDGCGISGNVTALFAAVLCLLEMSLGVGLLSLFLLLGVIPNPYPFGCGKNCGDNCGEGGGVIETQGLSDEEVA